MKFKSKIDWWFYLVTIGFIIIPFWFVYRGITENFANYFVAAIFILLDSVLILPLFFNTNYTFTDTALKVKSGLCCSLDIPYQDITSFKETRNPLASAGLSLDRIEIQYKRGGLILISPIEKSEFIIQLQERTKLA